MHNISISKYSQNRPGSFRFGAEVHQNSEISKHEYYYQITHSLNLKKSIVLIDVPSLTVLEVLLDLNIPLNFDNHVMESNTENQKF